MVAMADNTLVHTVKEVFCHLGNFDLFLVITRYNRLKTFVESIFYQ